MMRIVDLTLTVRAGMRGVAFEKLHAYHEHGWNSRMLHLYSHSCTHMDAPLHFAAVDDSIDHIPLERCFGPAWVVDLRSIKPKELITVRHLGRVAERFRPDEALLLHTGWSAHVDQAQFYRNNFPRISEELSNWCVERKVRLLGVEMPSVADVNNLDELTTIHRILLGHKIVIVEGLANLHELRQERVLFCAAPLKIEGGDGSPCRAFAIEGLPWPEAV